MPNNNRYEISEALQMPLPLTKEEAMQETLTQEESAARRFPILPSNANVTVIPIIPGITLFGYIRFLNASPVETRVDIYANGRRVAADLRYQHFTEYMKLDPYFRKDSHHMMTFAMSYAYSEDYILVLSHDEVVHLKCSMINKMPGLGFDKYANLKAGYAFMMGHAGKKLLFMGQDFAQLREWSEERELDWYLLEEPEHQAIQSWMRDLLHMYKKKQALYELDQSWEGFEWVNADDAYRSIYSFIRHSKDGKHNLLFVINFTPMEREDYRVGVPRKKQYKLILNSDDVKYGGNGEKRQNIYHAVKKECDGRPYSFGYKLPPYGVAVFEF